MPLAFDLISTLVMGSTLPVATTLLAKSPRSTLASFDGSILVPPRVSAITPMTAPSTTTTPTMIQIKRFRRFFFPLVLPFTLPSRRKLGSCFILRIGSGICSRRTWETAPFYYPLNQIGTGSQQRAPVVRPLSGSKGSLRPEVFCRSRAFCAVLHSSRTFGMLELEFHDCFCPAAGVADPAAGGGQRFLRCSGVCAGQRARYSHPAVD